MFFEEEKMAVPLGDHGGVVFELTSDLSRKKCKLLYNENCQYWLKF